MVHVHVHVQDEDQDQVQALEVVVRPNQGVLRQKLVILFTTKRRSGHCGRPPLETGFRSIAVDHSGAFPTPTVEEMHSWRTPEFLHPMGFVGEP